MVSLMIYSILEYFFPGGFCPLHILSITTYIQLWQWLHFGGFCPGRILSREDFVLYLCSSLVSLIIYGIFEYFFSRRILSRRMILSSAFILHYYLHSVVVMIVFWRILSWGDFILGKILSPTHALLYCATIVFWRILNLGRFCPGRILSSAYALYYGQHSDWVSNLPGGFCPRGGFCPQPTRSI